MANILENYLDNLADAIRLKTGGTANIEAMDFASEIKSIPQNTTGIFQEKTVSLTTSGATEVTPDTNYDAMTKVTVTPKLQAKTVNLTSTGKTTITADSGNVGLSSVAVTPTLQDKTLSITSNTTATVTPDDEYAGLKSVTITTNVSGGKLGGSFNWNHYNTSSPNNSQTYYITIPANKQYAVIVFVINAQSNTPRGSLEVTSQPSNITLSAIGSVNGGREANSVQTTTYCYLATKTSNIASAATITFKNDWSDTGNGYGNGGCTYGVFYNV